MSTVSRPLTPTERPQPATLPDSGTAVRFMEELLEHHETLNDIAIQYGSRTLADLMYMQQAILTGGFVDAWPNDSGLISVLLTLRSVDTWRGYVVAADPSIDLDALFDSSSTTAPHANSRPQANS